MSWSAQSWAVIDRVHASLPADASYEERRAALVAAYPFNVRQFWPYKQWCKAQRKYLARYRVRKSDADAGPLFERRA